MDIERNGDVSEFMRVRGSKRVIGDNLVVGGVSLSNDTRIMLIGYLSSLH